jgi:hypothetical protein
VKVGDLVRFRYPYRESEKGAFLVVRVEGNTWLELHRGPDLSPNGRQTLHNWTLLELINEST